MHPELFEEAKAYEARSLERTQGFTWAKNESLEELERPERIAAIEENWAREQERRRKLRANLPLAAVLADAEAEPEERDGCLICAL